MSLAGRLGEELDRPELPAGSIGFEKPEARAGRVVVVDVGVADVVVDRGLEARLDARQLVLEYREVDGDPQPRPQTLLMTDRPVRAATDEIAQALGPLHERDGHDTRRVADL